MKKRNTNKVLSTFISFITTCLVAVFFVLLVGCDDVKKHTNHSSVMTTEEYNSFKKENTNDKIAVISTFTPTLEITDYINNTSLEDIILHDIRKKNSSANYNKEVQHKAFESMLDYSFLPQNRNGLINATSEYVYVPVKFNLAKVFYLEDFYTFIKINSDYYQSIESKYYNEQNKKREQERQESWDKYLK